LALNAQWTLAEAFEAKYMHLVDNWQRPAADDINPDALEYLFANKVQDNTPWVRIAGEAQSEPVARITPEYIRLQTRVEILKGIVELTNEQLHEAHHQIGMQAAELARRDVLLQELSDYRAKAAMSIAYQRQNDLLRNRVEELQQAVQFLGDYAVAEQKASHPLINASNYVVGKQRPFSVSSLSITTAVVIVFAMVALITVLN
jgi:hypothetical protein